MTIPRLIDTVLHEIHAAWYRQRPTREYHRDKHALTQAIARYGYECLSRGWNLDALSIQCDLSALLLKIRETGTDIKYLPVYLEGAVDTHIRTRAEELSAQAKTIARHVQKTVSTLKPGDIRPPTDVEVLAVLYKDLRGRRRKKRKQRSAAVSAAASQKQAQLL